MYVCVYLVMSPLFIFYDNYSFTRCCVSVPCVCVYFLTVLVVAMIIV